MQIKNKLSINFTLLTGIVLFVFSILIYLLASENRKESFYTKLENRAYTNANLLIVVKEVDSTLLKIIDKNTTTEFFDEEIIIYDKNKKLIYSSNDKNEFEISDNEFYSIETNKILKTHHEKNELVGLYFTTEHGNYYVIALAYDKYGFEFIRNLRIILIIVFLISLITTLIVSYFYSKSALLPINKIINQLKKIKATDLNFRIDEGNKQDEIALLAINFNQMLDKLQNTFETQKLFLSGASHELRTPLTSIMGEIEVALLRERENYEYKEVLSSVLEEIKALNILSNNLLELAQTSVDFADIAQNKIRIDEIVFTAQNEIKEKYPDKEIKLHYIKFPENEDFITVLGNKNLLVAAVKNIIDNACKYSSVNPVKINFDFDNSNVILSTIDLGIGINEDDKQKIFTPFFRAANAKKVKGKGIGLLMVKKIIELHKGEIEIKSQLNEGTSVTVKIPNLKK